MLSNKDQDKSPNDFAQETDKFWEDPQNILNLIDLIFLSGDAGEEVIPS